PPAVPTELVEAEPVTSGSVEVSAAPAPAPASGEPASPPAPAVEATPAPVLVAAAVPQPAPRSEALFAWPVKGEILSTFGPKPGGLNNDGINIAAPSGTPVLAAENGVVVYAGNEIPGFGNLLLIRHADGWATAYAHNARLLVGRDDRVARGQPIAEAGATGSVTTPQVHFEVRKGNDPVDPMKYLAAN
ncbi:MAG: peptidoglycan DD-metalloendopeptidase family protein, partial [Alphaproteobacteria bacterium]